MNPIQHFPYFFEDHHRALVDRVQRFARTVIRPLEAEGEGREEDEQARTLAAAIAQEGLPRLAVPRAYGGEHDQVDIRSLCLVREGIASASGFGDSMFAMQGLGSYPITLAGSESQKKTWLPAVASGDRLCAFALTERNAGSDVVAMETTAERKGAGYVLNGSKRYITNAGVAGSYVVFAKTNPEAGHRGISAFIVTPEDAGFRILERQQVTAPHPIGEIGFEDMELPEDRRLGEEGDGFKIAMGTLDRFRPTVGAAAIGLGLRALEESMRHTQSRNQFGAPLFQLQAVQMSIAQGAADLEAARMQVFNAAWHADHGAARITYEAALGKLGATEAAFRMIDSCVQVHGGAGVLVGGVPERLYREIRALRIYEGASDVQKLVIARQLVARVEVNEC